jgi:hypothetical protein
MGIEQKLIKLLRLNENQMIQEINLTTFTYALNTSLYDIFVYEESVFVVKSDQ